MASKEVVRVGLTGGVGSGKSTVAALLRKRGIQVINLDELGREVLKEDDEVHAALKSEFGEQLIKSGTVDRRWLQEVVFQDPVKRNKLEAILHPRILAKAEALVQDLQNRKISLVVIEAALLIERNLHPSMKELVVVIAGEGLRRKRVIERDGISEKLVTQIMGTQVEDIERRRAATVVIENNGSEAALELQIDPIVQRWRAQGWIS